MDTRKQFEWLTLVGIVRREKFAGVHYYKDLDVDLKTLFAYLGISGRSENSSDIIVSADWRRSRPSDDLATR